MSSKSSILYFDNGTHVYEDTNEWNEEESQWAIYWGAEWADFKNVEIVGNFLFITFKSGQDVIYPLLEIEELDFNVYGFLFKAKFGTKTYKDIQNLKDKEAIFLTPKTT